MNMSRRSAFFVAVISLIFFSPSPLLAKVVSNWYQPHYMDKVDDANTRIQFLAPHFIPGNIYGYPAPSSSTFTLDRMTGSNLGLNIFFTETGVEEKPQGLLGLTSISTPYRRDSVTSIVFAAIDYFRISNISNSGLAPWCVIPVGGDESQNNILCVPSEDNAHQLVDALATLAVAYGQNLFTSPGMVLSPISEKYQRKHPEQSGCLVGQVDADGPATQAGIREGDNLRTVNGAPCGANTTIRDAILAATAKPQGGVVRVEILRKNIPMTLDLAFTHVAVDAAGLRKQIADLAQPTAASAPAAPSSGAASIRGSAGFHLGISVRALIDSDLPIVVLPKPQGVLITRVEKDSVADEMQMQVGDVILQLNGVAVDDAGVFGQSVRSGAAKDFSVWRKGKTLHLTIPQSM
jgi:membrane-associated protease RseP (regulator of RpoE activity)